MGHPVGDVRRSEGSGKVGKAGVYVAFLRGINLAGKNKLPMADLARMFAVAGCDDVTTYIQSGNVVYRASHTRARNLATVIEAAILKRFGYRVPLVVRTARELRNAVVGNPFVVAGSDANMLHLAFLAAEPSASRVSALDPQRSPPDQFSVAGRDIYLRLPNGVARTKLSNAYFDAKLATTSTMRNWRTVLALRDLTDR